MNKTTQNDLSENAVKLDYQALKTTAKIAAVKSLEQLSGYITKMQKTLLLDEGENLSHLYLVATWIQDEGKNLAIAADTLAALIGGQTRDHVIIVNKEEDIAPCPTKKK